MAPATPPHPPSPAPSRRRFLGGAATAALLGVAPAHAETTGGASHSPAQIAARDAANLAAAARRRPLPANNYAPLTGGIVHFFGYGESLSNGWYGVPVLSATQPYDNLMIGQQTRGTSNPKTPNLWAPIGTPSAGLYSFAPMIAAPFKNRPVTAGETPGEGALNFFRRAWLQQPGLPMPPTTRFVLTNCAPGGATIAQLSKGANPEIFNWLRNAATSVQASAAALGLSYQVGGMIWTQGEQDTANNTSYAAYLASLQTLQQSFLTDIVQTIAGAPPGTTVPWFCDQPDCIHATHQTEVYQALLDWSNTPGSDLYLAGPTYQYPDHSIHLTANGYRWHANQVGKAMANVLLNNQSAAALQVTAATYAGQSILIDLYVPAPPLMLGDVYVQTTKTSYPALGFIVTDSAGHVPISAAAIVGQATIQLTLARKLQANPTLQSGYNLGKSIDWGTNICDSDTTVAQDIYQYTAGIQSPGEAIATWNGAPLIGQPYPLNNYLAVGTVPITPG